MKEIKVSSLKKKLKKHLKDVSKSKKVVLVKGKKSKKDVVIISKSDFNDLKEKANSYKKDKEKNNLSEPVENEETSESNHDDELEQGN